MKKNQTSFSFFMENIKILLLFLGILFFVAGGFLILKADSLQTLTEKMVQLSFAPAENPKVQLVVGGDIMLSRGIGRRAKKEGYDRTFSGENYHPLSQFPCYASGDCLLYFNLESMFALKDNDQPKAWFLFRANTGNIQTLLDLKGQNELLLSLANNHTNNAGAAGVELTCSRLGAHDIGFFGAGNSTWEAQTIFQTTKNWIQLCFQAFSYDGKSGIYGGKPLAWNPLELALMTGTLQEMQGKGCELKILGLHRGAEYRFQPNKKQIELAHQLIDAGADVILGGHSHIPWSYENYQGKPIFYSFGNFLFDQERGKRATGKEFNYSYDYELKRKTVPTYIPLLAALEIEKTATWIQISAPIFKMARLNKGIFAPLDEETFSGLMAELVIKQ